MDQLEEIVELPALNGSLIVVDGRNVQRSKWPNVSDSQLIDRIVHWKASSSYDSALVVFDGVISQGASTMTPTLVVIGTGRSSADDAIVDLCQQRALEVPESITDVVTSDRGLKDRLHPGVGVLCGGGAFLRYLGLR